MKYKNNYLKMNQMNQMNAVLYIYPNNVITIQCHYISILISNLFYLGSIGSISSN